LLKNVPGREPIANPTKKTPAIIFPQKKIINNRHMRFASETDKEEKKENDDKDNIKIFEILGRNLVLLIILYE
tara:strand:+ start:1466 stop:1684 length:219 start_codon:yes stop_codon:yes gene_type:complete